MMVKILIDGAQLNGDCEYRNEIGYMPQIPSFPENLNGKKHF